MSRIYPIGTIIVTAQRIFIMKARIVKPKVFPFHPLLSQKLATSVPNPPNTIVSTKQSKAVLSLISQWAWGQQQYSTVGLYI